MTRGKNGEIVLDCGGVVEITLDGHECWRLLVVRRPTSGLGVLVVGCLTCNYKASGQSTGIVAENMREHWGEIHV